MFLARLYERLGKSLFYAALVLVALYALDKVVHTGLPAWVFPAAVVPLSLIGGFVWAWRVRPTELEAAVGIDGSLGLKERISSALALGEPSRPIEEALIADAASKVKGLEPQRVVRFVTPRELKWLWAPAVLALLLVTLVPSFDLFGRKLAAEERKQTEQENRKEARRIKAQLDKLKRKLGKDPVKRNKSLLQDMERIASDLEKADSPDARKRSMREMQALGDKLKDSQASAQAAAAVDPAKKGDDSTKTLREALGKEDFTKASDAMRQMKAKAENELREGETNPAAEKLSKDLKGLSQDLSGSPSLSEALNKAAEGLEQGNSAKALQNLDRAAEALKDMENVQEQLELFNEMMSELDKTEAADPLSQDGGQNQGDPLDSIDQQNVEAVEEEQLVEEECDHCAQGHQQQPGQQ
ncbi:MAG TPA: hypothetical protein DEA08_36420, partial [Planctomycetes bacterium]|nr:hypothetical protein [Planctomycetota bacterium]